MEYTHSSLPTFVTIPRRGGLTLIELVVVVAIVGILIGMLLPGVMVVRESARQAHCGNQIRQLGLAVQDYAGVNDCFPHGATFQTGHSWITESLPFLELESISNRIDRTVVWDAATNQDAVFTSIPIVQCPTATALKSYPGFTDYCGLSGSTLGTIRGTENNGIFFPAPKRDSTGVRLSQVEDGLSYTIAIVEAVAVTDINQGYWACGWHCFTQDDGGINNAKGGSNEIASLHPTGANVAFADGSIHFLNEAISIEILGALCTRNGREVLGHF